MLSFLGISVVGLSVLAANPPKFDSDFASHLTDEKASIYVIKGEGIDKQNSLIENIQLLVVPTTGNTGLF
ncbi:MAG: hypothetical protein LBD75_00715 [Candidatus Peribacteria bacterium]|nr:hypothetical protein [Candidatus Peribacteria bacterium]